MASSVISQKPSNMAKAVAFERALCESETAGYSNEKRLNILKFHTLFQTDMLSESDQSKWLWLSGFNG